jgi:hypothetical protein
MGKTVKKVAAIALPIAVMAIPGLNVVAAGAIGGALSGVISGGGLKGAAFGALTGGVTAGIASGAFKGAFQPGGMFGGQLAGAGQGATGSAFMAGRGFTGVSHLSNVGSGMATLGQKVAPSSASMFGVKASSYATAASGVPTTGGALNLGRDAMFARTQAAQQSFKAATSVGAPTVSKAAPSLGATEGSSKILGFDKAKVKEIVGAGFSAYEGDIRQSQIDALQENLGQFKSEHADFYSQHAKENLEKLDRGELPEAYEKIFDKEEERLTRLMIAQGHNPAEAGLGAETVVRGIADMKAGFINQEKQFYASMAGGAEGMQSRIAQLQFEEANKLRPRETGLAELGTSVAGAVFGDDDKSGQTLEFKIT